MSNQKKLLEAALFMSSRPLMLNEIAKILNINSLGYVKELLEKLQKDYENRGIELAKTAKGWQLQVRQDFLPSVASLTPYHNISEGSKRTLALIVYKEPARQSDIIRIQGNKAYSYIKALLKMNLINVQRSGRTKILTLTQEFERYFGEEKKRIKQMMDARINRMQNEAKVQEPMQEKAEKKPEPAVKKTKKKVVAGRKQKKVKPAVNRQKAKEAPEGDQNVEITKQALEELVL